MKKVIIAYLLLVCCLTIGCVKLDDMVENYTIQKQSEIVDLVSNMDTVDSFKAFAVEREYPLAYSYEVIYRDMYTNRYYTVEGTVDVIDIIKSNR